MSKIQNLVIDPDRCIGCQACISVCPSGLISSENEGSVLRVQFATTCSEECTRCADECSEDVITFMPAPESAQGFTAVCLDKAQCSECRSYYVTEKMASKLRASLSSHFDPDGLEWISMCPSCRRKAEASQGTRTGLINRSLLTADC